MAGGIDWFRWHHGSVTDPKFQLVARKSGASLPDVLAVWAYILEKASAATERGAFGEIDAEALDCLFGFPDTETRTADVLAAMEARGLTAAGRIARWEDRQPKRERDPAPLPPDATPPKTSTERSRASRARKGQLEPDGAMQRHATPCNATDSQATPREEESREEKSLSKPSASHPPCRGERFDDFWLAWPKNERKQDKAKCLDHWKRHNLDAIAETILADVRTKRGTTKWGEGFIEAPLVYLRGKRWEDGVTPNEGNPAEAVANWWSGPATGIRQKGIDLEVGDWDETREQWHVYRARVFAKAGPGPWNEPKPAGMPGVVKSLEPA